MVQKMLTVPGRITVVKTLLLPLFTHLVTALPCPDSTFLKSINTMFYQYIWNCKRDRVARNIMVQNYFDGGLKMLHLEYFVESMHLSWFYRICSSNAPWIDLFHIVFPTFFQVSVMGGGSILRNQPRPQNMF